MCFTGVPKEPFGEVMIFGVSGGSQLTMGTEGAKGGLGGLMGQLETVLIFRERHTHFFVTHGGPLRC